MRVFLAGASGVLGVRLTPLLIAVGCEVAGMTRSPAKASALAALGAEPVVCDVYDAAALEQAVRAYAPDMLMHQLTDLPDDAADLPAGRAANARIRQEGTANLLAAAAAAGVKKVLAQSVAWEMSGEGKAAKDYLEQAVLGTGGVVLRYGQFYGPDTYYPDPNAHPDPPRIHIDEAAARTATALDLASGIYALTDTGQTDFEPVH
ncbi:NAD-dependent epimerase/dehydratase family protein [Nocardia blacklockiae]|uniref:NAD-dependent epimerase/dehydratase family protein n=1 Tax=Nocardia blacklockiae TaxID=480036 RepID=UPI001895A604|nr:NAD-dependent epimerase/dehydratase family protein [Nocardia blacklockiae]MBF6171749.1 NAD(P)H-binding protein [Nocardia blacklockiae]